MPTAVNLPFYIFIAYLHNDTRYFNTLKYLSTVYLFISLKSSMVTAVFKIAALHIIILLILLYSLD